MKQWDSYREESWFELRFMEGRQVSGTVVFEKESVQLSGCKHIAGLRINPLYQVKQRPQMLSLPFHSGQSVARSYQGLK